MTKSFWQVQEYFKLQMEETMKCPKCIKGKCWGGKVFVSCQKCTYIWILIPKLI